MKKIFYKNGYYCIVDRDINESYDVFIKRGDFIVSQKPSNKDELDEYIRLSRLWINMKLYNLQYNEEINKKIAICEDNI